MINPYHFISYPVESMCGDILVPGDKSISHRAILLGAIAQGITTVTGFLEGEDCLATLQAFRDMGVRIEGPISQRVVIHGVGKYGLQQPKQILNCGNSGTTMRLLSGLLAAQTFDSVLTGDESLLKRPMARVVRPLMQMGAVITATQDKPPISIHGSQSLHGITYEMPEASAQVKSCLLLAGLYAKGETRITEPELTRDHTERMLTAFSYPIQKLDHTIVINAAGGCQARDVVVPGDISSAAFFMVAATLIPGAELWIRNVGVNPTRTGVIQILQQMGANIRIFNQRLYGGEPVADVHVTHTSLRGIDIPIELVPLAIDEFPILFIAAACATGKTLLRGAHELRYKETDRIAAMADGLQRLGVHAQVLEDGILIEGGVLQGGVVESQQDHRIAMAFAIAGAVAKAPITILNCTNIATSFPNFINTASKVNLLIKETNRHA